MEFLSPGAPQTPLGTAKLLPIAVSWHPPGTARPATSGGEVAPSRAAGSGGSRGWPRVSPCLSWLSPAKKLLQDGLGAEHCGSSTALPRCPQSCPGLAMGGSWGLQHPGSEGCGVQSLGDWFGGGYVRLQHPKSHRGTVPASPGVPRGVGGDPGWVWGGFIPAPQLGALMGHPAPPQLGLGSPLGSEQWGRGPGTLSLPQHGRDGGTGRTGGCVPAPGSASRRHMDPRRPGRTLSHSTLAAPRVPSCHSPQRGTRAGGRRQRQSDTEGVVTSQGQLAAARRSPAAGTG